MNLHFDRLRTLWLVSTHGTLAAAAEVLGVTPSAVSQQIRQLEIDVGAPLFEPAGRSVALTDIGLHLAERAGQLIDELERTGSEMEGLIADTSGTVDVAAIPSAIAAFAPDAIASIQEDLPGVDVVFHDATPDLAIDLVLRRSADIAIIDRYTSEPRSIPKSLQRTSLGRDPLRFVGRKDLTAASSSGGGVELASLSTADWVLAPNYPSGQVAISACRNAGFEPRIRLVTDDLRLAREFVADGLGVSIQPLMAFTPLPNGTIAVPVDGLDVKREIMLLTRSSGADRPVVKAVAAALRQSAQTLLDPS